MAAIIVEDVSCVPMWAIGYSCRESTARAVDSGSGTHLLAFVSCLFNVPTITITYLK
jgi:hypothetical protein